VILEKRQNIIKMYSNKGFEGDLETYAREIVWYGRKASSYRHKVSVEH